MTRRQYQKWAAQHGRKRAYRSHARAWLTIARICIREREVTSRWRGSRTMLVPYDCRWTDRWEAGKSGPVHVHIGHQAWNGSRAKRRLHHLVIYPVRRGVIWPFFRARRRWRKFLKNRRELSSGERQYPRLESNQGTQA